MYCSGVQASHKVSIKLPTLITYYSGATEDAINQAREAFHAHLTHLRKVQKETTDYTDEELMMEEKDFEQDFSGRKQKPTYGFIFLFEE